MKSLKKQALLWAVWLAYAVAAEAGPSEQEALYYRLAVATVQSGSMGKPALDITLVEVHKQGEKTVVESENGAVWMTDGRSAVFFVRPASKGFRYSAMPDGMLLASLGGEGFALCQLVTERMALPLPPSRKEQVGTFSCIIWNVDGRSVPLLRGVDVRMTLWVPDNSTSIPIGFCRLQAEKPGYAIEVRLLDAKRVRVHESLFNIPSGVEAVVIANRQELLDILGIGQTNSK